MVKIRLLICQGRSEPYSLMVGFEETQNRRLLQPHYGPEMLESGTLYTILGARERVSERGTSEQVSAAKHAGEASSAERENERADKQMAQCSRFNYMLQRIFSRFTEKCFSSQSNLTY